MTKDDTKDPKQILIELFVRNIPRDLVLSMDEALVVAGQRAFLAEAGTEIGHLANALGQSRHFKSNETFHAALKAGNCSPTPLNGNKLVIGRSGIFNLARFTTTPGVWNRAKCSKTRRDISQLNRNLQVAMHGDLFEEASPEVTTVSAFFVSLYSGSTTYLPEAPLSIEVAIPTRNMDGWLLREPISTVLGYYDAKPTAQVDLAKPTLKEIRKPGQK